MKRFSSLFITLFLIVACQNQVDATQTIPANTATAEITLTSTSQPTIPPQATPTQNLSVEFPEWVKNRETQILLVPVGTHDKGYENMALFNADTGERFDVPFTEKARDYFWMPDGSGFGFLNKNKLQVDLFSIRDEKISIISISKESLKFIGNDVNSSDTLQLSSENFNDSNFIFLYTYEKLSPNKQYFIYQKQFDESFTSVMDISKKEIVYLSDPNDEYIDLYSEWSPISNLLAIVEVDEIPEMWNTFNIFPTFRLRIYDVESQEVVASYKNVTFPTWSPDGKNFLFQEWKREESGYFYDYKSSSPCIYNTVDGTTNCYNEVPTKSDFLISSLDWSPDQSMIAFISYQGFCTITLDNSKIHCILETLVPEDQNILSYNWSPDGNFISFIHDLSFPYSDWFDSPKLGIANIKTGEYFTIGENINFFSKGLWRPTPTP